MTRRHHQSHRTISERCEEQEDDARVGAVGVVALVDKLSKATIDEFPRSGFQKDVAAAAEEGDGRRALRQHDDDGTARVVRRIRPLASSPLNAMTVNARLVLDGDDQTERTTTSLQAGYTRSDEKSMNNAKARSAEVPEASAVGDRDVLPKQPPLLLPSLGPIITRPSSRKGFDDPWNDGRARAASRGISPPFNHGPGHSVEIEGAFPTSGFTPTRFSVHGSLALTVARSSRKDGLAEQMPQTPPRVLPPLRRVDPLESPLPPALAQHLLQHPVSSVPFNPAPALRVSFAGFKTSTVDALGIIGIDFEVRAGVQSEDWDDVYVSGSETDEDGSCNESEESPDESEAPDKNVFGRISSPPRKRLRLTPIPAARDHHEVSPVRPSRSRTRTAFTSALARQKFAPSPETPKRGARVLLDTPPKLFPSTPPWPDYSAPFVPLTPRRRVLGELSPIVNSANGQRVAQAGSPSKDGGSLSAGAGLPPRKRMELFVD